MRSDATTVEQYLDGLPPERRPAIEAIRAVILKNLSRGFAETMQYGMIGYVVPHSLYPAGYHCNPREPLPFASLASQKNHMALYMMSLYEGGDDAAWFRDAWQRTGLRLDMGKCCVRFRRLQDVPLGVVAEAFRRVTPAGHIAMYERARAAPRLRPASAATAKPVAQERAGAAAKPPERAKSPAAKRAPAAAKAPAGTRAPALKKSPARARSPEAAKPSAHASDRGRRPRAAAKRP